MPRPPTIAKTAVRTGRSIRDLVLERKLFDRAQLDAILSAEQMTSPGIPGQQGKGRVKTRSKTRVKRHPKTAKQ